MPGSIRIALQHNKIAAPEPTETQIVHSYVIFYLHFLPAARHLSGRESTASAAFASAVTILRARGCRAQSLAGVSISHEGL
jgi:hypothetical protein